ncbi:MAG TPA: pitrilysin family protein, partial [Chloroflexota bacterium]|nr:pitrilysin family protein [Chloroflexota bacterium]
ETFAHAMRNGTAQGGPFLYQKSRLDNGLRVVTSHIPHARSVSATFFVRVGSRNETDAIQGASHFLEHMLFKGTEKRPSPKDISEAIEGIGGYFNAEAGKELTVYWDKVADRHWTIAVEVLADLLRHSRFEATEIEKERKVIAEELGMLSDSPGDWVHILVDEAMWGDKPLGRDVAGTRESVLNITRDQLLDWFGTFYVPANLVISVAGPLDHAEVVAEIERLLGSWDGSPPANWAPAGESPVQKVKLKSKRTEQAHFCLSVPSLPYDHPERYALELLNIILGEGMSSRLFLEIREKHGLAYDVHSYTNEYQDAGSLVVYAGVEPARIDEALRATLAEIGRLAEPIPEAELARAKEFWKGRMLLRLEDTRSIASWLGAQELLLGQIYTVDDVIERVDRVQTADLQTLAERLFVPDKLCLAVIGPYRSEDRFARQLRF